MSTAGAHPIDHIGPLRPSQVVGLYATGRDYVSVLISPPPETFNLLFEDCGTRKAPCGYFPVSGIEKNKSAPFIPTNRLVAPSPTDLSEFVTDRSISAVLTGS